MKKIHRFLTTARKSGDHLQIQDPEIVHQIRSVLKLRLGETVALIDGKGTETTARIVGFNPSSIEVERLAERSSSDEPIELVLCAALLKREHFELIVQKAAEIGVSEIIPLRTRRTVKLDMKRDRLERILHEAVEQSGGSRVPVLHDPISFEEALRGVPQFHHAYFFDVDATPSMTDLLRSELEFSETGRHRIAAFIGPEGGWDPHEVAAADAAKCERLNLGKRVLRGETAAIVVSYFLKMIS